jgi:hypothetical protein
MEIQILTKKIKKLKKPHNKKQQYISLFLLKKSKNVLKLQNAAVKITKSQFYDIV